ncbi:ORF45 peptide [Hyphantria cunea nucleopolyhedrovirus]|uniref:ORF45 peptide n=1 Tax=Hyphantria cunea nuclear polyhedrosis virus TaxID=28288 RepID=Q2NNY8_NPVHC|nr:ORF45 peptide [Hyphantria cunea nucleopolyhedrovirus]BAE72334.1 ORF45 peptide [Hyphantria cunea nucleopolyhedrovirus]
MKYFLSATFLIIIFLYAIYFCVVIIVNNKRVQRNLFYQYNYIPASLLNTVKVHNIKWSNRNYDDDDDEYYYPEENVMQRCKAASFPVGGFGNIPSLLFCNKFYMCAGPIYLPRICTHGHVFNRDTQSCEQSFNVDCHGLPIYQ